MNAKVSGVFIGISPDHGVLTGRIYFDLADGGGQVSPYKNLGGEYMANFIQGICRVFEVSNILDIVGMPCVVGYGANERITHICNFIKQQNRFDF